MLYTIVRFSVFFSAMISFAFADQIHGAGATFPSPIYQKWAVTYNIGKADNVDYLGSGSGEGIRRVNAKEVDFGASDMPLKNEELNKKGLLQFPMLLGAITPVVNLPGVFIGQLRLDGSTLAAIYLGKIHKWNDPQLRDLNPGLKLPDLPIHVVYRGDKSGTSFNFTNYLSKVSTDWQASIGEGLTVNWPIGQAANANAGVSEKVKATPGAIGYLDYAFALEHQLDYVQLKNRDGYFVKPSAVSTQAAASGAQWDAASGFYQILTNVPGEKSWPIAATTFILFQKDIMDGARAKKVLSFFDWAYRTGELSAMSLDYIMIPKSVMSQVRVSWGELKSKDGKLVRN